MWDIIRDAPLGQCLRLATGQKAARYPEEQPGFELPAGYFDLVDSRTGSSPSTGDAGQGSEKSIKEDPIVVVGWYGPKDPDNPYNWSSGKKLWIALLLFAYSFAVYIGSSLYTAGTTQIIESYGVSSVVASLGLSMYVFAYGIGPLLWAPLLEIPAVGRTLPYITTFVIFVVLCVLMSLVNNMGGILALRFLMGFFGSPCLATAGASYADIYSATAMPYVIALWGGGGTLALALGPLVAGYAVEAKDWHWSSWELLWLSGPIMICMFLAMPETSLDTILHRRAQRLRALTGRANLKSESEIRQAKMNPREIAFNALIKPWEINALDPVVLFSTFYMALTYGIYYSFFESFPLVYTGIYGFSTGEQGLAFLSILCGLVVAVAFVCWYFYVLAPRHLGKYEVVPPEARLWPGLFATWFIPISLLIFAWTSDPAIHWVVSLLGVAISMCGVFIVTQAIFMYLPFTYPCYAASLFAANALARSLLAGSAILFATPMFEGIGISGGVSLLAALSLLCVLGLFLLYFFRAKLRERSKFTGL
ncbi:MFS general substrate transporter [Aspergillus stella-maris]|uniref:MFS general substrate transporter n=1 Tax=Aspergillus stella-maris TaxID=1810926 RepID=UPI003CCDC7F7